jgi:ATP-binding protein involved in chromosome partitioning
MDPAVRQGGDEGIPVVIKAPNSPVARALTEISKDVAAKISVAAMQKSDFIPINMIG